MKMSPTGMLSCRRDRGEDDVLHNEVVLKMVLQTGWKQLFWKVQGASCNVLDCIETEANCYSHQTDGRARFKRNHA